MPIRTTAILALALALPVACAERADDGAPPPRGAADSRPAWLLAAEPSAAAPVADAKAAAAEGDEVVVRGRIGGRRDPMSADSAAFVIIDPALPSCADNPDDGCPFPWDYCCETPETIAANNATVQVVDADGRPIETDLRSFGFEPLDEVVVVGVVAPRPEQRVLTIRATGLYKVGG